MAKRSLGMLCTPYCVLRMEEVVLSLVEALLSTWSGVAKGFPMMTGLYAQRLNHYKWIYREPGGFVRSIRWRLFSRKSNWRYIFVYSAPRSGTTLLQLLLGSHTKAVHVPGEAGLHYVASNLFERSRYTKYMHPDTLEGVFANSADFADFVENFYSATNDLPYPFFITEKIPPHFFTYNYARWKFPHAKFIAVVRDGRDSFCSARRHEGVLESTGSSVEDFARIWSAWTKNTLRLAPRQDCYFLRYEDLVRAPEKTLRDIMAFSGFEFEAGQLDRQKRALDNRAVLPVFAKLKEPISSTSIGQFKTMLARKEIEQFEAVAGACLVEAGYKLEC